MKVVVTGGSGQLGTLVLRRLIDDRGVERVVDLDLVPPMLVSGKLEFREVDIRDRDRVQEALQGCDAVIHLAFAVTARLPRAVFDTINVGGSENVFGAAAAAGVHQIVYCSSTAAYGVVAGHPQPIIEDTPRVYQSDFPYAAAKYRVEAFLDRFETEHPELRIARLRPSVMIGRRFGNPLGRLLAKALDRGWLPAQSGQPLTIVWDEDVADAVMLALQRAAHGAFNLSAEDSLPPEELAVAAGLRHRPIANTVLRPVTRLLPLLARLGLGEPFDPAWSRQPGAPMVVSSERARVELGWKPRCLTAADVLRRYLEVAPGRDRRLVVFFRLLDLASRLQPLPPGSRGDLGPVHLCLTGKGGGDFTLRVERGRFRISRGIPRPPASAATLRVSTWFDLVAGQTTVPTAQMTGKLRLEGDPSAGFVLAALTRWHKRTPAVGARGRAMRGLFRWLTRGAVP